jgi:hypothetical protein
MGIGRDAGMAMILAALTFGLLLPYLDASMLSIRADVRQMPDEGTVLSNADRVSRGQALYREVFDFKGPISYLPYVLADRIAPPTARTGRLTMFAILATWAAAMSEVALLITGRRVVAVLVALWVPLQIWQAWTYAYQDFTAQLLLVLGVLCALVAFDATPDGRRRAVTLGGAGVCAALVVWTSLAQGVAGLVALGGAVTLVAGMTAGRRAGLHAARSFGLGALLGSAAVFGWLASMRAVRPGLEAMLIFPFSHYRGAANDTGYGFDAAIYSAWWTAPRWIAIAAGSILGVTEVVPILALAVALGVVTWVIAQVARPRSRRRRWRAPALARLMVPASLAATALPVILKQTRSDICHLGFIEGGCLVAILAALAGAPRTDADTEADTEAKEAVELAGGAGGGAGAGRPGARMAAVARVLVALGRGALFIGLGGAVVMAAAFYAHALRIKPAGYVDLDVEGRIAYDGDFIAARTRPDERVVVTSYGGWQYLYARRDNATSFALLLDDPYCAEQWPIAARQIVTNRPRLLLVPEEHLRKLASYAPEIAAMYFGYSGNYMLDDRGPGPPFALPARWVFAGAGIAGSHAGRLHLEMRADGGPARLLALIAERQGAVRAAIYGDLVSVFDGVDAYVGKLSPDGTRIAGTRFGRGGVRRPFAGKRLGP